MNKKIILSFVVLLSAVTLISSVVPALAEVIWTEHATVVGETIINVAGKTPADGVRITFAHFDGGNHGVRDNLALYIYVPIPTPNGPVTRQVIVAWYSDTVEGVEWNSAIMANTETLVQQLKPCQLQVYKLGKTAIAIWTVTLEVPPLQVLGIETPAVKIPPGMLIIRGDGDISPGSTIGQTLPSGYILSATFDVQNANGLLLVPKWIYLGATTGTTTVKTDFTQTASI